VGGSARGPRRRALLVDVAARAGVDPSTASRALRDDPHVAPQTRLAVKAAAAELDFVPNMAARSLRLRRTHVLGILIPDLQDAVHGEIISGFELEARQGGYAVIMAAGENDAARERLALEVFMEHGTDGVAIVSSEISPRKARGRVDPDRLVLVQPDYASSLRRDGPVLPGVIQTDDASGMREAVDHLVDCGYRRIAYVGVENGATSGVRRDASAAALLRRGVTEPLATYTVAADAWRTPAELAAQVSADLPDAILCFDDKLALGLMDALRSIGIRVPDDLGLVGFDGIPATAISNPRLTTVATPTRDLGRLAAAALMGVARTGQRPAGSLQRAELVVRESTRRLADRPGTARAD
jgi:LacI family transcriptional regulator